MERTESIEKLLNTLGSEISKDLYDLDLKFNFVSELTGETEALDIPFGIGFFYPTD